MKKRQRKHGGGLLGGLKRDEGPILARAAISPLVRKVLDWLEDEVRGLEDGQRLSTELELAARYQVSR